MNAGKRERVLVFGDDMRIFLAVVRSLGRAGKEVHAVPFGWDAPALKSRYVAKIHRIPRYSDDSAIWRSSVRELLRTHQFDLVVPCCDDRSILPFNNHREDFAEYNIAIPNAIAVHLLFDKERTRQLCLELGIPVTTGAELDACDAAAGLVSKYGLPLVIKPRQSYALDRLDVFGKVWIVEREPELRALLESISEPSRFLVEAHFEGVGVGLSVLADHGKILHAFQHRRLREGRGGSSSYRVSEPINDEMLKACQKICDHTKLTGVCMLEFRYNPLSKAWILLETNARFWGSSPLPLSLGVDFPVFLYDLLVHRKQHAPVPYEYGIRARNFVLDGFNLISEVRYLQSGNIGRWIAAWGDYLTQPVRWLTGRERSDSFVWDDLRPALWECAMLFTGALRTQPRPKALEDHRQPREQTA